MKQTQRITLLLAALALIAAFVVFVFAPSQSVSAITDHKQLELKDCLACHDQAAKLWEGSHHKEGNVSCTVCHKLSESGGVHPDNAKYTVESEESTCLVCHADVAGANIAGQLALSQHGKVGLTCVSCHEQHSQGLKLSDGSQIVCENCHKKEMKDVLGSTHFKAGLSCVNCHMGEDKNHTLIVAVQTCDECHTDLHEAKRMLDAGLEVKVMDKPDALVEIAEPVESHEATPAPGGIQMPAWTLVFSGMLVGGVLAWALVGKDPGKSSDDNE